jgi:4'-phosphopantetheinyl transferase
MNLNSPFFDRERVPKLANDCVHVWRITTAARGTLEWAAEVLSPEEGARADRFHFERDRRAFIVCRGALRKLISGYTGLEARSIRFNAGTYGKPLLMEEHASNLRFNVSHSGEIALLAFSLDREIGVDVEFKRGDVDFVELAEMSFSKKERAAVLASAPADRSDLFYEYWTCKEACIKADGRGLSVPLDQFSVAAREADSHWREIITENSGLLPSGMRSRILKVGKGYAAAAVTNIPGWQVLQMDLEFA